VSSKIEDNDLERQTVFLWQFYRTHELITDVKSGLNFKRRGFQKILAAALDGDIEEVVVLHRDRLVRFAFDLIEFLLEDSGARLVVHHDEDSASTNDDELADDLLSVVHVFMARKNGARAAHRKRCRKATRDQGKTPSQKARKGVRTNEGDRHGGMAYRNIIQKFILKKWMGTARWTCN
jgi:putative resolvase